MEKKSFSKRFIIPVCSLLVVAIVSYIGYNYSYKIPNPGVYHLLASISGLLLILSIVFGPIRVYPATYRRGSGAIERVVACLIIPLIYMTKEVLVLTGIYTPGEALYFYINPVHIAIFAFVFLQIGILEMTGRRRLKKLGEKIRVFNIPAVISIVVSVGVIAFLLRGIGVYAFYLFQEGYKALFGFGVGV